MSYIQDNLMPGEEVIYRAKLHGIIFIRPVVWFSISLFFFTSAVIGEIVFLISLISLFRALVTYLYSEFGITDKRIIGKVGFIRRTSLDVFLIKVESIQVKQGIFGRILGYGSITITGTGGVRNPFRKISYPLEFRKKVQEQITVATN